MSGSIVGYPRLTLKQYNQLQQVISCLTIEIDQAGGLSFANQSSKSGSGIGSLSNCPQAGGNPAFWVPCTLIIGGVPTAGAFPWWLT